MEKKWALVTGASSGIGRDLSLKIAGKGYNLAVLARREAHLLDLQKEVVSLYPTCQVLILAKDLRNPESLKEIWSTLEDKKVSLLVNNAGYGLNSEFVEAELSNQTQMIDLNCKALVALTHMFLPGMIERNDGQLVQVASVVAYLAAPYFAVYAATKAFVLSFSKALMMELDKTKVRVLVVCPGPTETEFGEVANYGKNLPPKALTQSSEQVAQKVMDALSSNKSQVLVTGLGNKVMVGVTKAIPSSWVSKISASSLRPAPKK